MTSTTLLLNMNIQRVWMENGKRLVFVQSYYVLVQGRH